MLDKEFHYDMIAWNENCFDKTLGYKLYYIGKEYNYEEIIEELIKHTGVKVDKIELEKEISKVKGLYLAHVSYCLSTDEKEELNLYFKG